MQITHFKTIKIMPVSSDRKLPVRARCSRKCTADVRHLCYFENKCRNATWLSDSIMLQLQRAKRTWELCRDKWFAVKIVKRQSLNTISRSGKCGSVSAQQVAKGMTELEEKVYDSAMYIIINVDETSLSFKLQPKNTFEGHYPHLVHALKLVTKSWSNVSEVTFCCCQIKSQMLPRDISSELNWTFERMEAVSSYSDMK